MSGVVITGRYRPGEPLHPDDAAACAVMGRPAADEAMRRFRNELNSHQCPACGGCAVQFMRTKHTCELPVKWVTGTSPSDSVVAECWFCSALPFYPPWIPEKERRADLIGKTRAYRPGPRG